MITATLVFLNNLDFHARIQKFWCNSNSVWDCDFSSAASTAEIKPVLTKKDEFQYGDKFFLLARFDFFLENRVFWFKQEKGQFFRRLFFHTIMKFNQNVEGTKFDCGYGNVCDDLSLWVWIVRSFCECLTSRIIRARIRKEKFWLSPPLQV